MKFTEKGKLNKHVDSIHEGKKPFQCDICQKSFTQKASMTTHILTIHEGEKPHHCEIQGVPSIGTHFRFQFLTFLIVQSKISNMQF